MSRRSLAGTLLPLPEAKTTSKNEGFHGGTIDCSECLERAERGACTDSGVIYMEVGLNHRLLREHEK